MIHYLMPASRRWWDKLDDYVVMGGLPFTWDISALHAQGVGAVVSLNEQWELDCGSPDWNTAGVPYLHLPTIDHHAAPTQVDIQRALVFIRSQHERRVTTYVHCKAGRGRSSTIVLCWLMYTKGWAVEEALEHVLRCRPQVKLGQAQREALQIFASWQATHGTLSGTVSPSMSASPSFQSIADLALRPTGGGGGAAHASLASLSAAADGGAAAGLKHCRKPSSGGLSDLLVSVDK